MAMPTVYALIHARILPTGVEIRVKTPDAGFTQAVAAAAAASLK
jgi:hypothetical protein